ILAVAAPISLRITRKDGTKQDIPLNPGDKIELISGQPPVKPVGGSPFEALRRENIPAAALKAAGGGDPALALPELVAVLGESQEQEKSQIKSLNVSPDGCRVYTTSEDKTLRTWDVPTGKELAELRKEMNRGDYYAVLSLDGKRLAWNGASEG